MDSGASPKHRLLFELGRGGMGTVFLAVTEGPAGFSKLKVVKRLRADLAADPQFLQMFLEEARLAARLSHPNVVQTNEVGFDGSHYYLEMEFLDGQSLDVLLRTTDARSDGGMRLTDALFVLAQVLAGLHYAHELRDISGEPLSVVHRDVSPHNVLVTYDGNVKVLDFGIAKAKGSSVDTRTGVVKGKVNYMAPEQAARTLTDRRADVFAVGIIMWQVLTRRRLWSELSEGEIFLRLERGEIPAPRDVVPDLPEELDAICKRAVAKNPDDRFATAEEFQRALEEWIDARGDRSGTRTIAALMRDLFEARREETRQKIEGRLRGAGERTTSSEIDVPILASDPAYAETRSREIGPSTVSGPRVAGTPGTPPLESAKRVARGSGARIAALIVACTGIGLAALAIARRDDTTRPSVTASLAPSPAPAPACITNAACGANGAAQVCRRGACVALASDDCSVLAEPGDVARDDTIWFGAMFPLSGADAKTYGKANANAVDLARRDFATMASGIPSARAGKPPRSIALVLCDDSVNPTRAAQHLTDVVGVPAIIGFHRSKELVDLATSTFVPRGVVAISALNSSPLITRIAHPPDSPRLVWRTTVSTADWTLPLGRVVSDVFEKELRASGVVGRGSTLKVAVVRMSNSATLSFADALFSSIHYNEGKSGLENGDDFRQFVFDDHLGDASPDYSGTVADLLKYKPHVVVYLDAEVFTSNILPKLEDAWPKSERHRPRYVTSGLPATESLFRFIGTSAERRHRFLGVDVPSSTMPNVKFTMRYNEIFAPKVTPGTAPGVAYDAFYVLAYAAYAAGLANANDDLTGTSIARAIGRLVPPGVPVDVGPAPIFDAIEALRAGKNIDLDGTATKLDFTLATGESASDFAIYCVKADAEGKAFDAMESGLVHRAGTASLRGPLQGTMRCP